MTMGQFPLDQSRLALVRHAEEGGMVWDVSTRTTVAPPPHAVCLVLPCFI